MRKTFLIGVLAALMLFAFTACDAQVSTYKIPASMTAQAAKTEYLVGEAIDWDTITATVTYTDGTTQTFPGSAVLAGTASVSTANAGLVQIPFEFDGPTYYGQATGKVNASVDVMVYSVESVTLSNLPTSAAWDAEKNEGVLDLSGVSVVATYNYGKGTRTLTADEFKITPSKLSTAGAKDVAVTAKVEVFNQSVGKVNAPEWKVTVAAAATSEFDATKTPITYDVELYNETAGEVVESGDVVYINDVLTWTVYAEDKDGGRRDLTSDEYYFINNKAPETSIVMEADDEEAEYTIFIPGEEDELTLTVPAATDYVYSFDRIEAGDGVKASTSAKTLKESDFKYYGCMASDTSEVVELNVTKADDPKYVDVVLVDSTLPAQTDKAQEYDPRFYVSYGRIRDGIYGTVEEEWNLKTPVEIPAKTEG